MCEDGFYQRPPEAKATRNWQDVHVGEMGTEGVVYEQPAEADLCAIRGVDAEAQAVRPTALCQRAWPA